jgi:NhaA family Na+:H+ antiporter
VVLLLCTVVALALANSPWAAGFLGLWKTQVGFAIGSFEMSHSLKHWINDGLMAVFFFVIGLEVKREIVLGELVELRKAALPIAAALGGMIVPAGLYLLLQGEGPARDGWGVPMATDIAFVVGCLAVLGSRVPHSLRILLLSLAIADDIGAILVIAIGYTASLNTTALWLGVLGIGLVWFAARVGVRSLLVYTLLGALTWLAFHESGVHATIAGVILGLMTPTRAHVLEDAFGQALQTASDIFKGERWRDEPHRVEKVKTMERATREAVSPLEYLEATLHPWVGFVIMPVFALANAGVPFELGDLGEPVAVAVQVGLVVGKPLGIVLLSYLAVRLGLARLPADLGWKAVLGGGMLDGIGFTMALFIADLALQDDLLDAAKVGVLAGSALSMALGVGVLLAVLPRPTSRG